MKKLLLLLMAIPLVAASEKNASTPTDMEVITVPFSIGCFNNVNRMKVFLKDYLDQTPKYYMKLRPGSDGWIFISKDNTNLSIVIRKATDGYESTCIVWSGKNVDGEVFTPL